MSTRSNGELFAEFIAGIMPAPLTLSDLDHPAEDTNTAEADADATTEGDPEC